MIDKCESCGAKGFRLSYSWDHGAWFCDGCYERETGEAAPEVPEDIPDDVVCPDCGVERTDYEGIGKHLDACPSCGSEAPPGVEPPETAEVEVERLTRECLDRESTETDARERLQRAEERLAAVEALAENWDGFLANRGDEMSHAQKHAWTTALDELRAALRKPGGGRP